MKKIILPLFIISILVLSMFASAENVTVNDSCSGFFGSLKCFVFGDSSKRAAIGGKAWWDGSNVAGMAGAIPGCMEYTTLTKGSGPCVRTDITTKVDHVYWYDAGTTSYYPITGYDTTKGTIGYDKDKGFKYYDAATPTTMTVEEYNTKYATLAQPALQPTAISYGSATSSNKNVLDLDEAKTNSVYAPFTKDITQLKEGQVVKEGSNYYRLVSKSGSTLTWEKLNVQDGNIVSSGNTFSGEGNPAIAAIPSSSTKATTSYGVVGTEKPITNEFSMQKIGQTAKTGEVVKNGDNYYRLVSTDNPSSFKWERVVIENDHFVSAGEGTFSGWGSPGFIQGKNNIATSSTPGSSASSASSNPVVTPSTVIENTLSKTSMSDSARSRFQDQVEKLALANGGGMGCAVINGRTTCRVDVTGASGDYNEVTYNPDTNTIDVVKGNSRTNTASLVDQTVGDPGQASVSFAPQVTTTLATSTGSVRVSKGTLQQKINGLKESNPAAAAALQQAIDNPDSEQAKKVTYTIDENGNIQFTYVSTLGDTEVQSLGKIDPFSSSAAVSDIIGNKPVRSVAPLPPEEVQSFTSSTEVLTYDQDTLEILDASGNPIEGLTFNPETGNIKISAGYTIDTTSSTLKTRKIYTESGYGVNEGTPVFAGPGYEPLEQEELLRLVGRGDTLDTSTTAALQSKIEELKAQGYEVTSCDRDTLSCTLTTTAVDNTAIGSDDKKKQITLNIDTQYDMINIGSNDDSIDTTPVRIVHQAPSASVPYVPQIYSLTIGDQVLEPYQEFTLEDSDVWSSNEQRTFRMTDNGAIEENKNGNWERITESEFKAARTNIDGDNVATLIVDGQRYGVNEEVSMVVNAKSAVPSAPIDPDTLVIEKPLIYYNDRLAGVQVNEIYAQGTDRSQMTDARGNVLGWLDVHDGNVYSGDGLKIGTFKDGAITITNPENVPKSQLNNYHDLIYGTEVLSRNNPVSFETSIALAKQKSDESSLVRETPGGKIIYLVNEENIIDKTGDKEVTYVWDSKSNTWEEEGWLWNSKVTDVNKIEALTVLKTNREKAKEKYDSLAAQQTQMLQDKTGALNPAEIEQMVQNIPESPSEQIGTVDEFDKQVISEGSGAFVPGVSATFIRPKGSNEIISTDINYDYAKNPYIKASEVIDSVYKDVAINPQNYQVIVGGKVAIRNPTDLNDKEYYPQGTTKFDDSTRIKMTENTQIKVNLIPANVKLTPDAMSPAASAQAVTEESNPLVDQGPQADLTSASATLQQSSPIVQQKGKLVGKVELDSQGNPYHYSCDGSSCSYTDANDQPISWSNLPEEIKTKWRSDLTTKGYEASSGKTIDVANAELAADNYGNFGMSLETAQELKDQNIVPGQIQVAIENFENQGYTMRQVDGEVRAVNKDGTEYYYDSVTKAWVKDVPYWFDSKLDPQNPEEAKMIETFDIYNKVDQGYRGVDGVKYDYSLNGKPVGLFDGKYRYIDSSQGVGSLGAEVPQNLISQIKVAPQGNLAKISAVPVAQVTDKSAALGMGQRAEGDKLIVSFPENSEFAAAYKMCQPNCRILPPSESGGDYILQSTQNVEGGTRLTNQIYGNDGKLTETRSTVFKSDVLVTAGNTAPKIATTPVLSQTQKTSAETYNKKSESLTSLKTTLANDPAKVQFLQSQGINVQDVLNGNADAVAALQSLIGATTDAKFGPTSKEVFDEYMKSGVEWVPADGKPASGGVTSAKVQQTVPKPAPVTTTKTVTTNKPLADDNPDLVKALTLLGYAPSTYTDTLTGKEKTDYDAALRKFQTDSKLKLIDGVAGKDTIAAINNALRQKSTDASIEALTTKLNDDYYAGGVQSVPGTIVPIKPAASPIIIDNVAAFDIYDRVNEGDVVSSGGNLYVLVSKYRDRTTDYGTINVDYEWQTVKIDPKTGKYVPFGDAQSEDAKPTFAPSNVVGGKYSDYQKAVDNYNDAVANNLALETQQETLSGSLAKSVSEEEKRYAQALLTVRNSVGSGSTATEVPEGLSGDQLDAIGKKLGVQPPEVDFDQTPEDANRAYTEKINQKLIELRAVAVQAADARTKESVPTLTLPQTTTKSGGTTGTSATPSALSSTQIASAQTYNKGSSSKLSDLNTFLTSSPAAVAVLTEAKVDINKVRSGDPKEIAYLQQIMFEYLKTSDTVDGKFGPASLEAMKKIDWEKGADNLAAREKALAEKETPTPTADVAKPAADVKVAPTVKKEPTPKTAPPGEFTVGKGDNKKTYKIKYDAKGNPTVYQEVPDPQCKASPSTGSAAAGACGLVQVAVDPFIAQSLIDQANEPGVQGLLVDISREQWDAAIDSGAKIHLEASDYYAKRKDLATKLYEEAQTSYNTAKDAVTANQDDIDALRTQLSKATDDGEKARILGEIALKQADLREAEHAKAEAEAEAATAKAAQDEAAKQKNMETTLAVFQGVGQVAQQLGKLGKYQGLSNLLFPETTKKWQKFADNEFMNTWSDITGRVSREVCEYDQKKRSEIPGKSVSFIHTSTGAYQFVGSLQAEKSSYTTPVMCEKNTAENATEEWTCPKGSVCVNSLCYAGTTVDEVDPDIQKPLEGYLYKITWGVTAPQDLAYTPYVDEDGIAIRFNIELQGTETKWIFKRAGTVPEHVMELKNGASDGGTIFKALDKEYSRVCIKFAQNYRVKDDEGDYVDSICANFIITTKSGVEYGVGSSGSSASVVSTSAEVEMDI